MNPEWQGGKKDERLYRKVRAEKQQVIRKKYDLLKGHLNERREKAVGGQRGDQLWIRRDSSLERSAGDEYQDRDPGAAGTAGGESRGAGEWGGDAGPTAAGGRGTDQRIDPDLSGCLFSVLFLVR